MEKYSRVKTIKVSRLANNLVAEVVYKDGKSATFSIDRGSLNDKQLLQEAFRCVFIQVEDGRKYR